MLVGELEVCTDRENRAMLWREGFERYYPNGIDDEDYCVLKFTAYKGNYYHGLNNCDFDEGDITS
jgi:general stress protein 26